MINNERWYTITELMHLAEAGFVPFLARSSWLKEIREGNIVVIRKGDSNKKTYLIQGKDLIEYLDGLKIRANKS